MRVYDITRPLGPETHIWDDGPKPEIRSTFRLDMGDFATVSTIAMGAHSGTHADAPAHFAVGGATIDAIPAETLVGRAIVVEHVEHRDLTAEDLVALGIDGRHHRVLLKTPNGRLWERDGFQTGFVGLTQDAAEHLVNVGVRLVGIDYLSIEPYEAGEACPVHHALLGAGVVVLEGADLRDVPPGEYVIACAPLRLVGAEGSPARVFLIDMGAQ